MLIDIYTDGACSGNPGAGGWAALILVLKRDGFVVEEVTISGGEEYTTNNRMELKAVLKALEYVWKKSKNLRRLTIKIHSDSSYVVNSINNGSLARWCKNGGITKRGTQVSNLDMWSRIYELNHLFPKVEYIKVKGHSGHEHNEYVDDIAVMERDKQKKLLELK